MKHIAVGFLFLWLSSCAPRAVQKPGGPLPAEQAVAEPEVVPLQAKLPDDTQIYVRLDPDRVLDEMEIYLRFIDPELARNIEVQARKAFDSLVRMAADRGFRPRLADHVFATRMHLVGLSQEPVSDDLPANRAATYCLSLVLECGPELAADFLKQVKAELDDRSAADSNGDAFRWRQLDVDAGELIRLDDPDLTIGRIEDFLVVSAGVPRRLWTAIQAPAGSSLADTERYGRFSQGDPSWFAIVYIRSFVDEALRSAEAGHRRNLRRADELQGPQARLARKAAEVAHEWVLFLQRLFGPEKLRSLGVRMDFRTGGDFVRYGIVGGLIHDEPLTRVLELLLDGGRWFRLPAAGLGSGLSVLWRIGPAGIYAELVEQLGSEALQQLQIMVNAVQNATGYSIADLLQLLSGDMYLFTDLIDAPPDPGSSDEARQPRSTVRNLLLLGIGDFEATRLALSKVYEALSASPMFAPLLSRRGYQDREVYLWGPARSEGEVDPDEAVAAVLLEDHLALGNWPEVTDMIRRCQNAPPPRDDLLAGVLDGNPQASFLLVLTERLLRRIRSKEGGPIVEELIAELRKMELDGDPALDDLRDAVVKLLEDISTLSERKATFFEPGLVIHGRHKARLYELIFEAELRKP